MDTDVGSSSGVYYTSQNVWMRDLSNGKVVFNPKSTSYVVNLGASYKFLNGTTVSSLTLGALSGVVLLKT
jgi:hypothetical protein